MSIENLYSYLEYLALSIDKLEESVIAAEKQSAEYLSQLQINSAQYESQIIKLEHHIQLQNDALKQAEQQLEKAANTAKMNQNKQQNDLFGNWQQPTSTKISKIANDQNAIILAQKLDSTIDKVQRLIGQYK